MQIPELLNIELSRWQQLIAANDCGYIPAMLKMDASNNEIEAIRKADRKAQGVTDMIKAKQAYHGAGENGYLGFCDYEEESTLFVKKVIELVANG